MTTFARSSLYFQGCTFQPKPRILEQATQCYHLLKVFLSMGISMTMYLTNKFIVFNLYQQSSLNRIAEDVTVGPRRRHPIQGGDEDKYGTLQVNYGRLTLFV